MSDDADYEALYDELVEAICGNKMIAPLGAVMALKQAAERMRWVPCAERLPEDGCDVLTATPQPEWGKDGAGGWWISTGQYAAGEWRDNGAAYVIHPTHWMPLPDAPR